MIAIYDKKTGEVVSFGAYPADEVAHYLQPGQSWLVVERQYDQAYVQNGVIIERPPAPDRFHEWNLATKRWVPNLEAAREAQRQRWNDWREKALSSGTAYGLHTFHCDDRFIGEAQLLLTGYERGLLSGTSAIRTVENETIQMDAAQIQTLLLAIGLYRQAVYAQSWQGKDALEGMNSIAEIESGGPPTQ